MNKICISLLFFLLVNCSLDTKSGIWTQDKVIQKVVEKFILELESQLDNKNVFINISPDAASWLGKKGYDKNMGARPLSRLIQEKVKKPIAEEILYGVLEKGGTVNVSLKKDKLNFVYKPLKKNNKIKKELLKN